MLPILRIACCGVVVTVLVVAITLFAALAATAAPLDGILTSADPTYFAPILLQGDTTTLPLRTTFFNNTGSTVSILEYVQDDASCPATQSTHDWIPLTTPIEGSIPSNGTSQEIDASIPFDVTAPQLLGIHVTNICIAQGAGTYVTALPVRLLIEAGWLVPPSGIVSVQHPSLIGAVLLPHERGVGYFHATFVNNTGNFVGIDAFTQDDPACPESPQPHEWVPMNPYPNGIPVGTQQTLDIAVPFDATNLASGRFSTYFCLLQSSGGVRFDTTAIPVELRVVAEDDVFQGSFD